MHGCIAFRSFPPPSPIPGTLEWSLRTAEGKLQEVKLPGNGKKDQHSVWLC